MLRVGSTCFVTGIVALVGLMVVIQGVNLGPVSTVRTGTMGALAPTSSGKWAESGGGATEPAKTREGLGPAPAGYVAGSVPVLNGTVVSGNFAAPDLSGETAIAFSSNGELGFIAGNVADGGLYGGAIVVANLTSNDVLRTIPLPHPPGPPTGLVYDAENGLLYVTAGGELLVLNKSSSVLIKDVTVGGDPLDLAFDPADGDVYLAGGSSNTVVVVNCTTNTIVVNVPVGTDPNLVAYDPANHDVYVANANSRNISIIATPSNLVVANLAAATAYSSIAYDSASGNVYLAGGGTGAVITVLQGAKIAWNFSNPVASGPWPGGIVGMAYDASNGNLYLADNGGGLAIVDASTNGSLGLAALDLYSGVPAYDPGNHYIYAAVTGFLANEPSLTPLSDPGFA